MPHASRSDLAPPGLHGCHHRCFLPEAVMVGRFRRLDLRFLTAHTTEGIAKSTTRPMVNSTGINEPTSHSLYPGDARRGCSRGPGATTDLGNSTAAASSPQNERT